MQAVGRKTIFLCYFRKWHDILRTDEDDLSVLKKKKKKKIKMIISLVRNTMFTEYRKVLVLNFSDMGNTVFFSSKKLM